MTNVLNKYLGFSFLEIKRMWVYKANLIVGLVTISTRLFLPYSVFSVLGDQGLIEQSLVPSLMWAILIGQILNRSAGKVESIIRDEIRSGDVLTQMNLPTNYILAKFFGFLGIFVVSYSFYFILFTPIFWILWGNSINLFFVVALSILAGIVGFLWDLGLGLTSFLIEENSGLFFISHKLYMLFGNQVIPVVLMPVWVINSFQATPFFLALAAPIEVASGRLEILPVMGFYAINLVILSAIVWQMYSYIRKRVLTLGG